MVQQPPHENCHSVVAAPWLLPEPWEELQRVLQNLWSGSFSLSVRVPRVGSGLLGFTVDPPKAVQILIRRDVIDIIV